MRHNFLSPVLVFSLITSMAGCVFYFKEQFALYSIKLETLANIKLEKEQPMRTLRAKPLKVFRPPRVIPGFIVFATTTLELADKLNGRQIEARKKAIPQSMLVEAQKVETIEGLAKNYIKDGYLIGEMNAFSYVSTTLTARLLAVYNALSVTDKPSRNSQQLKDTVKMILIENSETTFFEIMITFEDTLSAFPDVTINLLSLVEDLKITQEQKISYYSAYLDRKLATRESALDEDRERSIGLALEKLRRQGLEESRIKKIVENFLEKNADDPKKHQQAMLLSNTFKPSPTDAEWLESPEHLEE